MKANPGALAYTYPHTEFAVAIEGATTSPVAAGGAGGAVTFIPVVMNKGVTNKLLHYKGNNAYNNFIKNHGVAPISKAGQMFAAAERHLLGGGELMTINLRPADATIANNTIFANFKPVTKTFYVNTLTGEYDSEQPSGVDALDWVAITINTHAVQPVFIPVADIQSPEELELAIGQLAKNDKDSLADVIDGALIPIQSAMYRGVSKYGNNLECTIEKTNNSVAGIRLFNLSIFDRLESAIKDSFTVTHARDILVAGVPKSFHDVLNQYSEDLEAAYYSDIVDTFNDLFIGMLGSIKSQLTTMLNGDPLNPTTAKPYLEKMITFVSNLRQAYVDGDTSTVLGGADIPALDIFEIFADTKTIEMNCLFEFIANAPYTFRLENGSDGESFKGLKRFDFDYSFGGNKILVDLYTKAFSGFYGVELFDHEEAPIDYILDLDYPQLVKEAIRSISTKRPDVPILEVSPTNIKTIAEQKTYLYAFNTTNIRVSKMYMSVVTVNIRDGKPYRVGLPQAMIPNLNTFFNNNMKGTLAGGIVNGIVDGSPLPKIVSSDDKQWCEDRAINYLTKVKGAYMLDGQKSNMEGLEHPFKELPNQLIVGRVMKQILTTLNANRHLLDTPELIPNLNEVVQREVIDKFKGIIDISYTVKFKSVYNQKSGILTDEFVINGKRTVKIHDVLVRLVNN